MKKKLKSVLEGLVEEAHSSQHLGNVASYIPRIGECESRANGV